MARQLAQGSALGGYLQFLAVVADAQQQALAQFRPHLPSAEQIERAGEFGMPPIPATTWSRDASWLAMLRVLAGAVASGVATPAGVHRIATEWGFDLVGPRAALVQLQVPLVDPVAFEAWRIEQGLPLQPFDLDDSTIPQEAFLEQDAVSFTKGCFIGQELVCRIDSRGHVNRFLRTFSQIDGGWPPVGAEVVVDGKVVGALTSVAPTELPTGALGYVRREVEPPATVELRWDGGRASAVI